MIADRARIPAVSAPTPDLEFSARNHADPFRGVIETLLVVDGRAVATAPHLERIRASARALYGIELPAGVDAQLESVASSHALARVRIELVPRASGGASVNVAASALEPTIVLPAVEVPLVSVRVADRSGPHKLLDREWLEQIEQHAGPGVRALLVEHDGRLLETTRANVFLIHDGVLATPPLDGSILPGTVRAQVIEVARRSGIGVREEPLTLEQLARADCVLLSSSVRLLEHARGRERRASERVLAHLTQELRRAVLA
jgi:para-aminobenzoate synthetase/4-amino-4-deoxychorismate lyase